MELLLLLIGGHYLADFALQTQFVAGQKNEAHRTAIGTHCLIAHSAHHGLIAGLIVMLMGHDVTWPFAFLVMFITHYLIDLGKIRGRYGIDVDQVLHLLVIAGITLSYALVSL